MRTVIRLLCVVLCAAMSASAGEKPASRFEVGLGLGGRLDNDRTIDRGFSMYGALLYRLHPCIAAQGGLGYEDIGFKDDTRSGSSVTLDLLVRAETNQHVITPYFQAGIGYRHNSYQGRDYEVSDNRLGAVLGVGMALTFSDRLALDIGVRQELHEVSFSETTGYATPAPGDPALDRSHSVPDVMHNASLVTIQLRHRL
ncbi:porin family protein [bacterium]|nr:porin family protein [bacterium]MCB2202007.1 porin family protein [bacterium]